MKTIAVPAASPYEILLGSGLLDTLGAQLRKIASGSVFVVTDETVAPLYLARAVQSLKAADFAVSSLSVPAGEGSKSMAQYEQLLCLFSAKGLTRSDTVVALGGGVAGDLAGFAAATYLRGVRFVQVPTTLLAMVDASVGGKTALNLPLGKNLVGAFHQPALVLCDIDLLGTLPQDEFLNGCAEILKTAVLFDPALFATLCKCGADFDREAVISACLTHKCAVVCADERDAGQRQLLNLGHTVAHAIERCSSYTVPHGFAVAAGVCIMARCYAQDARQIVEAFRSFRLPTTTPFSAEALAAAAASDKKRRGDTLTLAVPYRVGDCALIALPVRELAAVLARGFCTWNGE